MCPLTKYGRDLIWCIGLHLLVGNFIEEAQSTRATLGTPNLNLRRVTEWEPQGIEVDLYEKSARKLQPPGC